MNLTCLLLAAFSKLINTLPTINVFYHKPYIHKKSRPVMKQTKQQQNMINMELSVYSVTFPW